MNESATAIPSFGFGALYRTWLSKKAKEAQDILLKELGQGLRLDGDFERDSFFSLLFRYLNAVKQGLARRNLRLLAQIINNGCRPNIDFVADELAEFADLVATLSRDELVLLAGLWRNHQVGQAISSEDEWLRVYNATLEELVPSYFGSKGEMMGVAASLLRTGCVTTPAVWGGNRIDVTSKFYKLMKLCNIESVLT